MRTKSKFQTCENCGALLICDFHEGRWKCSLCRGALKHVEGLRAITAASRWEMT